MFSNSLHVLCCDAALVEFLYGSRAKVPTLCDILAWWRTWERHCSWVNEIYSQRPICWWNAIYFFPYWIDHLGARTAEKPHGPNGFARPKLGTIKSFVENQAEGGLIIPKLRFNLWVKHKSWHDFLHTWKCKQEFSLSRNFLLLFKSSKLKPGDAKANATWIVFWLGGNLSPAKIN